MMTSPKSASTKSPPAVCPLRLVLPQPASREDRSCFDGAWWPRSRTLGDELPRLFAAWPVGAGDISRVYVSAQDWDEVEFLHELVRRTGCGLLVDVNNVVVSAANIGLDATAWIDAIDGAAVMEVHIAGHRADADPASGLLIDSHDAPVDPRVWTLLERLTARIGPRPTLLERDSELPPFADLIAERGRAQAVLDAVARAQEVPA